jgi:transcriptional regulator with XRE-family HTH domain
MDLGDPGTASDPLSLFCARLKRLQGQSGIKQAALLGAAGRKSSQVADILNGKIKRPPDWGVTLAIVRACLEHAKATDRLVPPDLSSEAGWRRRHIDLEQDFDTRTRAKLRREEPPGWLLAKVTDPFALEVHRPVQVDDPQRGLPDLPTYLPREHDRRLADLVQAAAGGTSVIAVLVGGSPTGKTRACWEALGPLRERSEQWRLWHPIDPSRPEAVLRELPSIGPRTVIWLNEAQFYLEAPAGGLGERVAAGLRELLRDPARAPVLVLATLWPQFWATLTERPVVDDLHAQARELLTAQDISVPTTLSADQLRLLPALADPRLAQAAREAEGGQVIQFLAGALELMARYRNAPPAAAALIDAAIDARRLGMGVALPPAFLEAAAPGYLTDPDWDGMGEDWLEQALAYTAAPCKGIRGPLARIRPRPGADPDRGLAYRLADYLDQHGRRARRARIPPASFWDAADRLAAPASLPVLAAAAEDRGLLRDAARLRKHATAQGNTREAAALVRSWYSRGSCTTDYRPAQWAVDHASLDDPSDVAQLLDALLKAGLDQQVADLTARNPAAHVALDYPAGVVLLLEALRQAGADQQVADLAARATAHAALEDPMGVVILLHAFMRAGLDQQAASLAARVAAHAALDDPAGVARLLDSLLGAGLDQQVASLAARAAAHATLDDPTGVARLLEALRQAGVDQQAGALVGRLPAEGQFDLFRRQPGLEMQYRFGLEPDDCSPAPPWSWDNLN